MFVCYWLNFTFLLPRINYTIMKMEGEKRQLPCELSLFSCDQRASRQNHLFIWNVRFLSTGRNWPTSSDMQLPFWMTHRALVARCFRLGKQKLVSGFCLETESLGNQILGSLKMNSDLDQVITKDKLLGFRDPLTGMHNFLSSCISFCGGGPSLLLWTEHRDWC